MSKNVALNLFFCNVGFFQNPDPTVVLVFFMTAIVGFVYISFFSDIFCRLGILVRRATILDTALARVIFYLPRAGGRGVPLRRGGRRALGGADSARDLGHRA